MKPQHLLLAGHILLWAGLLGIILCGVFLIDAAIQIANGGDEFTLSRDQAGWAMGIFLSLFVGVIGGASMKIKAEHRSKIS